MLLLVGTLRPICLAFNSANHSAASGPPVTSGPAVIPVGSLLGVGIGRSKIAPSVATRPMLLPLLSVNQSAPSGPIVIAQRQAPLVSPEENSVICAAARPIQPNAASARAATKARSTSRGHVTRTPLKREERTSSEITGRTVVAMRGFLRSIGHI